MRLFKRKRREKRVCPNCKNPVPADLAFCDACGFRVIPPPVCRKCQVPLAPDTNFCENCGTPAGAAPEAQPEISPQELPGTEEEERTPCLPDMEITEGELDAVPETQPETSPIGLPVTEDGRSPSRQDPEIPEPVTGAVPDIAWPVIAPPHGTTLHRPKPDPLPDPVPVLSRKGRIPKRTLVIAAAGILCLIGALTVVVWGAGWGDGLVPPGPSPAVTPALATITQDAAPVTETPGSADAAITGPPLVPGPVQEPPESLRIWLQEERDPITHIVTVIYHGGKGERAVRDVTVRLTRSDGIVLEETFRPLTTGEGVSMQGTRYADRLEVIVTYNRGGAMTVIDRIFPYHERN